MYICICNAVTDRHIEQAVQDGARTLEDLHTQLAVGSQCGNCKSCAKECLRDAQQKNRAVGSFLFSPC
ncbi:MAG: (2Fe-2S)-binding protein [Fluviibacter sp.]